MIQGSKSVAIYLMHDDLLGNRTLPSASYGVDMAGAGVEHELAVPGNERKPACPAGRCNNAVDRVLGRCPGQARGGDQHLEWHRSEPHTGQPQKIVEPGLGREGQLKPVLSDQSS